MLNILLAEDNPGDIFLIERAIEEHHVVCELHVVRDGAAALDFVQRMGQPGEPPCPDVLILDMNMPRADGPEILTEFRRNPECATTPVIVVSSSDAEKDRARMAGLGVRHYFRKPSDYEAFLRLGAIIREVI